MKDKELIAVAAKARTGAYAPYSNFLVGAAILTEGGELFTGVNIENSSFGLTICAERVAVFEMVKNGQRKARKIAIIGSLDTPLSPCGACRQVMAEFFAPETEIIMAGLNGEYKKKTLRELLPDFFNFKDYQNERPK
jgi:cytidine deaminase